MKFQNLVAPLIIMLMGVGCWVVGNMVGDRQGGTNIALTLIGIGGGLAKQEEGATGSTIKSENIENVELNKDKQ